MSSKFSIFDFGGDDVAFAVQIEFDYSALAAVGFGAPMLDLVFAFCQVQVVLAVSGSSELIALENFVQDGVGSTKVMLGGECLLEFTAWIMFGTSRKVLGVPRVLHGEIGEEYVAFGVELLFLFG